MSLDLEDVQQTVICIPYDGEDENADADTAPPGFPYFDADLEDGPQLRFAAYTAAWERCLSRVKVIIAELYAPVIADVLTRLRTAHDDVFPGLPFPELPLITITDISGGSLFLDQLSSRLELEDDDDDDAEVPTLVHHLYPSDCLNLTSAMRNLIGGFIDRDKDAPRRRPAASLAPYDLELLQAWYDAVDDPRPALVVLLHDFEQFDPPVVQDLLYICSLRAARLPLTLVFALSTPAPAAYLHAALPRATLALLCVSHFAVPAGPAVLDTILLKTFFDPACELLLLPGPTLLAALESHYETHTPSLAALLTLLQVAHLKHYTTNPLALLAHATPRLPVPPTARTIALLEALLERLSTSTPAPTTDWRAHARAPEILLQAADAARAAFTRHARRTKLGVSLLHLTMSALATNRRWTLSRVLEGDGAHGVAALLRTLPANALDALLERLHAALAALPPSLLSETDAQTQLSALRPVAPARRVEVADWVEQYIAALLQPLEDATPLWDVWYTGLTPFPAELVNPALRTAVVAGLAVPHAYTADGEVEAKEGEEIEMEALPDTGILFAGYARAGRLVNVYDWFDHFRSVLEGQQRAAMNAKGSGNVNGKGKGGAKGKGKATPAEEEDDERWKLAVQARFVRALHELDYLGFIKHTSRGGGGRKGEYVLRTVLGMLE
ncbi:origin recognition complex subunit 3 N-terminus-domain-containing protein [Mycena vulgaris]|nr:origin recognition complex subunit 3 N-terminus-domain-containing protein [Mycena vulgaris]